MIEINGMEAEDEIGGNHVDRHDERGGQDVYGRER